MTNRERDALERQVMAGEGSDARIREARDGLDYLADIIRDEQVKRYGQYDNDL